MGEPQSITISGAGNYIDATDAAISTGAFARHGLVEGQPVTYNRAGDYFYQFADPKDYDSVKEFKDEELKKKVLEDEEKKKRPPPTAADPHPPELIPDTSEALAIYTSPDIVKVGDKPVPFAVHGKGSDNQNYSPDVRSNGKVVKHHNSTMTTTYGAEPGDTGIKSNTEGQAVEPVSSSPIVRANGIPVQRHTDTCTLNNGNCPGEYVYVQSTEVNKAPDGNDEEDKAWYERAWNWTGDSIREANDAVWEFDRNNGRIVTRGIGVVGAVASTAEGVVGLGLMGVGGAASTTGVGAVPGVPAMIGGAALTTNAADNLQASLQTIWTGEFTPTALSRASGDAARVLGASPETAQTVENAVGITQGVGGGAGAIAGTIQSGGRVATVTGIQGARSTALPVLLQTIRSRLRQHLQTAQQNARLSPRQQAAVARNPNSYNMHMGTQIDTEFKRLVDADPSLRGLVQTTPRGVFGPDAVVTGQNHWFDVTTRPQWGAHVTRYQGGFGTGEPLFWP